MFLKHTLSRIFVSQNGSCVLTLYENTETRVPESGYATAECFIEILKFRMFLKQSLSHIFVS